MNSTSFLCIGHCCHDVKEKGYVLGGTASYAAVVARKLGVEAQIITSVGPDFLFHPYFLDKEVELINILASETTVFKNDYSGGVRVQYLLCKADNMDTYNIPGSLAPDIVLICPIADEVDPDIVTLYPESIKAATIQGWLRLRQDDNHIVPKEMDWSKLANYDLVFLSEEDIMDVPDALTKIIHNCKTAVLTMGDRGAVMYNEEKTYLVPSFPTNNAIDATGAGDVFTTAFLLDYNHHRDLMQACIYAHCAASFIVEGVGLDNLPDPQKIAERVKIFNH